MVPHAADVTAFPGERDPGARHDVLLASGAYPGPVRRDHGGPLRPEPDLEEGAAVTPPSAGMPCRRCGKVTENAVVIYGADKAGFLSVRAAQCRGRCAAAPPPPGRGKERECPAADGHDGPSRAVTMTATRPGRCAGCERDVIPGDVLAQAGGHSFHYECASAGDSRPRRRERDRAGRQPGRQSLEMITVTHSPARQGYARGVKGPAARLT
jgi:hypothetical protein